MFSQFLKHHCYKFGTYLYISYKGSWICPCIWKPISNNFWLKKYDDIGKPSHSILNQVISSRKDIKMRFYKLHSYIGTEPYPPGWWSSPQQRRIYHPIPPDSESGEWNSLPQICISNPAEHSWDNFGHAVHGTRQLLRLILKDTPKSPCLLN